MNRLKIAIAAALMTLPLLSCAGYNAYQRAHTAERTKNWDEAVDEYQKALEIDPDNAQFKMSLLRARLESSRMHFEKGKSLRHAAVTAGQAGDQLRLAQLAATELEITVKLDPTNQFAADEMQKAVQLVNDLQHSNDHNSIDEIKKRAKNNVTKTQPPQLNPASDAPISLSFPHETPVKDIYRALGNAFGINILFDQAVKDDKISIELKDVTAQQALERVMQAGNHFYKVLDEHTIIVVPDNPQARRDYEDLVIRTFYLSNGDAEQVTNVVRTMIEARNVFPLKALNAITIRDTADKVRIAEKIIEANDKAKAEVVVDVELLQLDLDKSRDLGAAIAGFSSAAPGVLGPFTTDSAGAATPLTSATLDQLRGLTRGNFSFSIPSASYAALKSVSNSQLLANPELRISEGEKATLHIGSRIPVPVSTFNSITAGTTGGTVAPVTSFQYQDVGIKVSMEPRVHHNREVTLKLTVEVSNQGPSVSGGDGQPPQPTFATRTIESTIRLKDGETNFLAGLIQETDENSDTKTPLIGEIPIIGRLFTQNHKHTIRTDLVMTMTPHIIRMPDITEDDVAPMWVGTSNNLTFRGVSPRIESQSGTDPFTQPATGRSPNAQFGTPDPDSRMSSQGEPVNTGRPAPPASGTAVPTPSPVQGSAPSDPFSSKPDTSAPQPQSQPEASNSARTSSLIAEATTVTDIAALRLSPRIGAQPSRIALKPGEEKLWSVVGMDLDGLTTNEILLHYDPMALEVSDISLGAALSIDARQPPTTKIDSTAGTIRISSTDGKPLTFTGGGNLATLRVHGGMTGNSMLVVDDPNLKNARGELVQSAIAGGRAQVQ